METSRYIVSPLDHVGVAHVRGIFETFHESGHGQVVVMDATPSEYQTSDCEREWRRVLKWLKCGDDFHSVTFISDELRKIEEEAESLIQRGQAYVEVRTESCMVRRDSNSASGRDWLRDPAPQLGRSRPFCPSTSFYERSRLRPSLGLALWLSCPYMTDIERWNASVCCTVTYLAVVQYPNPKATAKHLKLFRRMRNGFYAEGEAYLRVLSRPCTQLKDPVLYRVRYVAHPRAGNAWCIYPTMEFANWVLDYDKYGMRQDVRVLCDSEAEKRRIEELHYNLNTAAHVTVLPNCKIGECDLSYKALQQHIQNGRYNGVDDPRLSTIMGLHRRGYSPNCLKHWCVMGEGKSNGGDRESLEQALRATLDVDANRYSGLLRPLKIDLINYDEEMTSPEVYDCIVQNHPRDPSKGTRLVKLTRTIYIDANDYREEECSKFYGLCAASAGKEVGLRNGPNIAIAAVKRDESGEVVSIDCTIRPKTKCKAHIHWVGCITQDSGPLAAEFRVIDDVKQTFNVQSGVVEPAIGTLSAYACIQIEHVGYFCVDPTTTAEKVVLNSSVSIKVEKEHPPVAEKQPPRSPKLTNKNLQPQQAKLDIDGSALDIRVGRIVAATPVPDAAGLISQTIEFGDGVPQRQVITHLGSALRPEDLVGKQVLVLCNVKKTRIRSTESHGVVLCVESHADPAHTDMTPLFFERAVVGEQATVVESTNRPSQLLELPSNILTAFKELMTTDADGVLTVHGSPLALPSTGPCRSTVKNARIR